MPRPVTERSGMKLLPFDPQPGAASEPATFWDQPAGTDLVTSLNRLGPNKTPFSLNLQLNDAGKYITRMGLTQLGTIAADTVVGLVVASTSGGVDYVVRITETTVAVSIGGAGWNTYTGPALNIPPYVTVEFAAWNDKLMFTDQSSGLYEIDFVAKTYTLIAGAPVGKHLTVFGGRVVLSDIAGEPTRVQWSVKNDNADWVGLGSGFDDMLSAPGGVVDIQKGIYPITDTEAFVVRTSSIWVMSLTGYSDSPFQFSYRFNQGTDAADSIVRLPTQALLMLGRDDVMLVTAAEIKNVGLPIRSQLIGANYLARKAKAIYDTRRMVYRLYIPPAVATPTSSTVWDLGLATPGWHKSVYPFQITAMAAGGGQRMLSIAELTGTIGALTGPIGELGLLGRVAGSLFGTAAYRVLQESDSATTDVVNAGTTQAIPIALWSGLVQPGGPLSRTMLINLQIEYTSTRSIPAVIEVSTDGGTTWESYGTLTFGITVVPQVAVFRKSIERKQYQFRITAADAVGLQIIAAHAFGMTGAPTNL